MIHFYRLTYLAEHDGRYIFRRASIIGYIEKDETGCDVLVCRISEVDRVVLQPDGDASRADEAGHVPIREAVSGVEDDTPRKGCLQAASAARYGRAEDLAKILVSAILQMGLVTAAFVGDVAAKGQTAYQGCVAISLS